MRLQWATVLVSVVPIVVLVLQSRAVAVVQRCSGRALEVGEGLPSGLLPDLFPHLAGLDIAVYKVDATVPA